MSGSKILFQLTGSIACYKACNVISMLVKDGHEVITSCTESALKFIGRATLEGLTRRPVYTDMFQPARALDHIDLTKWADLAIVCPATANIISKLAHGIADDCISTLFLAYDLEKPFLIAPAMNQNMYNHPATRKSIGILKEWNVNVLNTAEGRQACGDSGPGRMLEPDEIYEEIMKNISRGK